MNRIARFIPLVLAIAALALFPAMSGLAQTRERPAPDRNRTAVSEALSKGDLATATQQIERLQKAAASAAESAAEGAAPASGSVVYEQIRACGFYPQETRLECILDIKQRFGYGGPVGAYGSFEFVYFCVDWNCDGRFSAGEASGMGIVQMHDDSADANPPWQYAVYRDIDPPGRPSPRCLVRTEPGGPGAVTQTSGPTHVARAILSWSAPPTSCSYSPVWGNVVDFRIRLDPIR